MFDLSQLSISFIAGTLGQGGAERQLYHHLSILKQSGARLRLFTLTSGEFWEERIQKLGVPVTCFGRSESRIQRLKSLVKTLRNDKPDVIQSQHFYTNLYAAIAGRIIGSREIGALRNDVLSEVRSVGSVMGSLSLKLPRSLAANSRTAIKQAIDLGVAPDKLFHLRNTVDTDYFTPHSKSETDGIVIAMVGRMVPQKRHDRLLSIISRVKDATRQPFKVIIAGDGPLREEIIESARRIGLNGWLDFRGRVADPREIYREASILMLTSDWEGTPNVVLEAMSSGLAVCATAVGDVPTVIQDGQTGLLADPQDDGKQVAALLNMLQNQALRDELGRRAREFVVTGYSLQQMPQRLQKFYKAVLQ